MAQDRGEQLALRCIEALRQIGLDLVANVPRRAPVLEAVAGDMQDVAQKARALAFAQSLFERDAVGDASRGDAAHRVEDEVGAAEFEKGAVPVLALRRADQEVDRAGLGDEGLQRLAGLVPVDQKDDARAEEGEETVEIGLVARPGRRR